MKVRDGHTVRNKAAHIAVGVDRRSRGLDPAAELAMDWAWRESMPWSTCHAACRTSERSASISTQESAIIHWIAWRSAMGCPKVLQVLA